MLATRQALVPLFGASVKMFYRSVDTVLFWAVSPLLFLGIFALVQELSFGFEGRRATIDFFSFSAIGYGAFIAAHFAQDGVVAAAAGYRASGVLKRIAVTPISPATFIAAQVMARLFTGVLATLVILALGVALGAEIAYTANLVWILPLAAVAILTGVGFAFAIAGAMGTPEAANQLNIGIFTPVFLLNGAQYPLDGLLGGFAEVAPYVIPFAAPIAAFRGVVAGSPITDFGPEILAALGWLALTFWLASRSYRFGEEGE
jgi:ABC-2 type transport system permease protein